jgi:hypothetical protein
MSTQPTPAAMRAASAIVSCGTKILGGLQIPLARIIDSELTYERERARELEAALVKCHSILRSINYNNDNHGFLNRNDAIAVDIAFEAANDILARLRADREGSK